MTITDFGTENYFEKYEFDQPYLLSASDCESITVEELLFLGGGTSKEFLSLKLEYPEVIGNKNLRRAIADNYIDVKDNQILVLGAPVEGIYLTMKTILKKGDHGICLSPAYDALYNVAVDCKADVDRWFLKIENNKWTLDFDTLAELVRPETKLLTFNFPHNPTGFIPTQEEYKKLIKFAKDHDLWVFSDEMYYGMELRDSDKLPHAADVYEKCISLGGMSKAQGLPGIRFGWLTAKDKDIYQKLVNLKHYTSMCSTQTKEYLGLMALNASDRLVKRNLKIVQDNIEIAQKFFKKWPQIFRWHPQMAGTVSVAEFLPGEAEKFCHEMSQNNGVVLLPLNFMGLEDRYVRFGLGRVSFKENLKKLNQALNQKYGKQEKRHFFEPIA